LQGDLLGLAPTGKTADLPIFCVFELKDGQIRRERFFFDRAELCEQLGLSTADVSRALAALSAMGRDAEADRG
jgi:hypothetical protein